MLPFGEVSLLVVRDFYMLTKKAGLWKQVKDLIGHSKDY